MKFSPIFPLRCLKRRREELQTNSQPTTILESKPSNESSNIHLNEGDQTNDVNDKSSDYQAKRPKLSGAKKFFSNLTHKLYFHSHESQDHSHEDQRVQILPHIKTYQYNSQDKTSMDQEIADAPLLVELNKNGNSQAGNYRAHSEQVSEAFRGTSEQPIWIEESNNLDGYLEKFNELSKQIVAIKFPSKVALNISNKPTLKQEESKLLSDTSVLDKKLMKFYNDEVTDILLHKHSYSREDYPSLSFKNYKIIYQIWNTNDDSKIVTTHPLLKENLSVKNFKTLSRSNWLNDEVINAYIKLILKREKDKGNDEKKFYIFNTFFYIFLEKLKKGTETLDKVMKVTRRAQVQISECSRFIIPMNPSNNHWDFMEIDNVKRTITFNDSLLLRKNAGEQPFKVISNFLEKAIPNEQNQSQGGANGLSHSNGYTYQPYKFVVNEDYPKQDNLNDCGVFMLKGIEFRSRNAKIDFDANDMLYFRNLIAYELYNGNLLNC